VALSQPALRRLRKWRINGFDNYLIFYLPHADGVSIIRVLYAAQDWWRLLGLDGQVGGSHLLRRFRLRFP
jgi:toxin ParE1/3/4